MSDRTWDEGDAMKEWKPCTRHMVRSTRNRSIDAPCPVCEIEHLQKRNAGYEAEIERLQIGLDACAVDNEQYEQANNAISADIERLQKRNALLEDVAVAAERANEYIRDLHGLQFGPHYLEKALDKLREADND